ncbi:MAG: hypothetical protein ACO24P_00150 [Candidatus Nanopelagicaceae bacterium]
MEDQSLKVIENEDGSLTIEWEPDHPFASIFDEWTEDDWIEAIRLGQERAEKLENG